MKTPDKPPILYGAVALAILSLAWSAYAITDLMHSGRFGLSVALAGDIGWITVLWAEYRGITIAGRRWAAPAAGWLIAAGVAVLLVIHGHQVGGRAQAIAGPFVVLVGKIVWAFALAALNDPTAPTPEQQAEIHAVMRDSSYEAQLHEARADAEIARIRAQARTTLARDEADFQVTLERIAKRAEIARRTPLALPPGDSSRFDAAAGPAVQMGGPGHGADIRTDPSGRPDAASGQGAAESVRKAATSADTHPDRPDALSEIAQAASGPSDLVRSLAANGVPKDALVSEAIRLRPDMVADSIRRTVKRLGEGPYL